MKNLLLSLPVLFLYCNLFSQVHFKPETIDQNVDIGYGLVIGDVNGDSRDDIILADKKAFVWYRNPDWTRFTLIDNLTDRDNVCIAARDINADGRVEIAVGAQWNPGETNDENLSGSVHYLQRPADPYQPWEAISLPHEPTVHRMGWVHTPNGYQLVVVPLHGRGNNQGQGKGVRIYAYLPPENAGEQWERILIDSSLHVTHNFDIISGNGFESLLVGSKEGSRIFHYDGHRWKLQNNHLFNTSLYDGFGEIRMGDEMMTGVQPFHGNMLTVYTPNGNHQVLSRQLKQGHALACADVLKQGVDQIIIGWREKNEEGEMGIKIFHAENDRWESWTETWIDKNGMACEDLKVSDLDGDGKDDIIAAGRSTNNLKIYWNRN